MLGDIITVEVVLVMLWCIGWLDLGDIQRNPGLGEDGLLTAALSFSREY